MNTNTLREVFKERYKVDLTDKEYEEMEACMSNHNIRDDNCAFEPCNDYISMLNNNILITSASLNRIDTMVQFEEIIYATHPIPIGRVIDVQLSVPKTVKTQVEINPKLIDPGYDYNIIILKSTVITSQPEIGFYISDTFRFIIYSKKLEIYAGIMFEPIEENENNESKG